jgi:hypothetical protein
MALDAEIIIAAMPLGLDLAMSGKDEDGRDARLVLRSTGAEESRKLSGSH